MVVPGITHVLVAFATALRIAEALESVALDCAFSSQFHTNAYGLEQIFNLQTAFPVSHFVKLTRINGNDLP